MPRQRKKAAAASAGDSEIRLLAWLATCVAVLSVLYYYQRGDVMLYGDAVAHINIARRVFDSKTPGLLQLGTVWLPLPHLLMIPFVISKKMWQTGIGGSIPSLVAYVVGSVGMLRLVRGSLPRTSDKDPMPHVAGWTAAIIYAANPNLIYMQTTAMGESLYLAFFIWTVVFFSEFQRGDSRTLTKCGLCLLGATLTRYDGWFLAAAMAAVIVLQAFAQRRKSSKEGASGKAISVRARPGALMRFMLIAVAGPALWLAYNAIVYRNPLEFENGPYSAKAIERRSQNADHPGHPGTDNLVTASLYFVKSGEANMAANEWLQRAWVILALAGICGATFVGWSRKDAESAPQAAFAQAPASKKGVAWPLWFLFLPVPFYALSVAYAGVPIFVPAWWPFTMYNVRYGLQLLPGFAAGLALLVWLVVRTEKWPWRVRLLSLLAAFVFAGASYAWVWRSGPLCLREAEVNMRSRNHLEEQLAEWLGKLPPNATILMYLGDHVGALERAGIPLKHVINEGNHRVWKQPYDPEGLWERALADPRKYVDYVVAFENDPVWKAVHGDHLDDLVEIHVSGQAPVILYRAR
ncbi:MAG TPA: hypothetical protein VMX38_00305 [Verrucomicrobiae bacterium]|jgi:hypothetical protein|nr:hypothetical protein [Verrucomicrobiae bacterium]